MGDNPNQAVFEYTGLDGAVLLTPEGEQPRKLFGIQGWSMKSSRDLEEIFAAGYGDDAIDIGEGPAKYEVDFDITWQNYSIFDLPPTSPNQPLTTINKVAVNGIDYDNLYKVPGLSLSLVWPTKGGADRQISFGLFKFSKADLAAVNEDKFLVLKCSGKAIRPKGLI